MDPNALHYQNTDENEPLYRAALLAAGAVGLLVVMAVGINFLIHQSGKTAAPGVRRNYETSPDDSVNGMRHELGDEPSAPVASQYSASSAGVNFGTTNNPTLAPASQLSYSGESGSGTGLYGRQAGNGVAHSVSSPPIHSSVIRDWASVSPDNISALLRGY